MFQKVAATRIHGLDTLRASAIVLVLMYHYGVVLRGKDFGYLGAIGWIGLGLFFVLSGYLIGNQTLQGLARGGEFSLKVFFARRLLRTLPNYYLILAVYVVFASTLGGTSTAPLWRFITFTQNIGLHYGETFTHSWSLCIEEQFYVILPVVCLLLARFRTSIRLGWTVIALSILAAMTFRGLAWWNDGRYPISAELYYSSFARFDELLPGVAIAMLRNFHRDLFEKILRGGNALLVAGVALTCLVLQGFDDKFVHSFFMTTFGFTLLAFSLSLLVMAALSPRSLLARIRLPGAASLALWSYAIYLAHKPVYKIVGDWLVSNEINVHAPAGIAFVILAGIASGWILYRLVETPFMHLRSRWFPANRMSRTASIVHEVPTDAANDAKGEKIGKRERAA